MSYLMEPQAVRDERNPIPFEKSSRITRPLESRAIVDLPYTRRVSSRVFPPGMGRVEEEGMGRRKREGERGKIGGVQRGVASPPTVDRASIESR